MVRRRTRAGHHREAVSNLGIEDRGARRVTFRAAARTESLLVRRARRDRSASSTVRRRRADESFRACRRCRACRLFRPVTKTGFAARPSGRRRRFGSEPQRLSAGAVRRRCDCVAGRRSRSLPEHVAETTSLGLIVGGGAAASFSRTCAIFSFAQRRNRLILLLARLLTEGSIRRPRRSPDRAESA
jgi:hypothetical protein